MGAEGIRVTGGGELGELKPSPESIAVQLTRMEGILTLISERGRNTDVRVDRHEQEIGVLKSQGQRLSEQAVARDATAVALAAALKEADETRRTKSESAWSPFTKLFAVVAVAGVLWGIFSPMITR